MLRLQIYIRMKLRARELTHMIVSESDSEDHQERNQSHQARHDSEQAEKFPAIPSHIKQLKNENIQMPD